MRTDALLELPTRDALSFVKRGQLFEGTAPARKAAKDLITNVLESEDATFSQKVVATKLLLEMESLNQKQEQFQIAMEVKGNSESERIDRGPKIVLLLPPNGTEAKVGEIRDEENDGCDSAGESDPEFAASAAGDGEVCDSPASAAGDGDSQELDLSGEAE